MTKQMVTLCDICEEQLSKTKCFICGKDICDDHNFGGKNASVQISAIVYNDSVFNLDVEDKFLDCCPNCTDKLDEIMQEKKVMMEEKLKEDLQNIKTWLLTIIKSG